MYTDDEYDRIYEERCDRARDAADDLDEGCGPECRGVMCCPTAADAARWLCGCGGGVDHSDCPEVDDEV